MILNMILDLIYRSLKQSLGQYYKNTINFI